MFLYVILGNPHFAMIQLGRYATMGTVFSFKAYEVALMLHVLEIRTVNNFQRSVASIDVKRRIPARSTQ